MANKIHLRPVTNSDLPIFFAQQLDPQANEMAAFTAEYPADRAAFDSHWAKIMTDKSITIRTILLGDEIAGHVASFERFGELEVTYWIGKSYWGRGVATTALSQFLAGQKSRPILARVAHDNSASRRVLEKCGFVVTAAESAYSNARKQVVEELILELAEA